MGAYTGDRTSVLFQSLSGFWQRLFRDSNDLEAFYQASETYLGQVYLDLMASVLGTGISDTPIFRKESWKLLAIDETELNYSKGLTAEDDRFLYDPPGPIVTLDTLQNSILDPTVTYERGVEFEVQDLDGILRFKSDPFRAYTNTDGALQPYPGVAWRMVSKAVGNRITDNRYTWSWYDRGVRRGDTLRLLSKQGTLRVGGTSGTIAVSLESPGDYTFDTTEVDFIAGTATPGGMLRIDSPASPGDAGFAGYYLVKRVVNSTRLLLDGAAIVTALPTAPSGALPWRLFNVDNQTAGVDSEIEYLRGKIAVCSEASPLPYSPEDGFWTYCVVRTPADPKVYGYYLSGFVGQETGVAAEVTPPRRLDVPSKHLVPGEVVVWANTRIADPDNPGETLVVAVEEGRDYTVDYLNGIVYQKMAWTANSPARCNYEYKEEVLFSCGGKISEYSTGEVMQLSLWAPEVSLDRFTLYYNYGSMLNRFAASSETYREYLRGIMALYTSGPVFQRMEAALNVAAGYPLIRNEGEVLMTYSSGVTAAGTSATVVGANDSITIPSGDYQFSEADIGGYILLESDVHDANRRAYEISGVDTVTNTVVVVATFGLVDETDVPWKVSREYRQTIRTYRGVYYIPYEVPVRDDIKNRLNWDVMTFKAFDALTSVFRVVDYTEDPTWWHGLTIPPEIWAENSAQRRTAVVDLVNHVYDADDSACYDDPGLYFDRSDDGTALEYTDNIVRHTAAYMLFDKYLKMHTFKIQIAADVPLLPQFRSDLEELVLISKPSHTYPFVGISDVYVDNIYLSDALSWENIGYFLGGEFTGNADAIQVAANVLRYDSPFPFAYDEHFHLTEEHTFDAPPSFTFLQGEVITLPVDSESADAGVIVIAIPATSSGKPVTEGVNFTFNWDRESVDKWKITLLTDWDVVATLTVTYRLVPRSIPVGGTPLSNYTQGWCPLQYDGDNPWYVRAGAVNPESPTYQAEVTALRTEHIDRPVHITVSPGE